ECEAFAVAEEEGDAIAGMADVGGGHRGGDRPRVAAELLYFVEHARFAVRVGRPMVNQRAGVRRPTWLVVISIVVGDLERTAASQQLDPDLVPTADKADEGNHFAIR